MNPHVIDHRIERCEKCGEPYVARVFLLGKGGRIEHADGTAQECEWLGMVELHRPCPADRSTLET